MPVASAQPNSSSSNHACVALQATEDVLAAASRPRELLTASENERADRFIQRTDRDDFLAAHVLVRLCLAELLGGSPADFTVLQTCQTCGGPHGKPSVVGHTGVHVSWSHAGGAVAAVAAHAPCGIDLEPDSPTAASVRTHGTAIRPNGAPAPVDPDLLDYALTDREKVWVTAQPQPQTAFIRLWLRKEALVKTGAVTLDEALAVDVTNTSESILHLFAAQDVPAASKVLQAVPKVVPERWALEEFRTATHTAALLTPLRTAVHVVDLKHTGDR